MDYRLRVVLNSGFTQDHIVTFQNQADVLGWMKKQTEDFLESESGRGIFTVGNPTSIYRIEHIAAIQFLDVPIASTWEAPEIGFRKHGRTDSF